MEKETGHLKPRKSQDDTKSNVDLKSATVRKFLESSPVTAVRQFRSQVICVSSKKRPVDGFKKLISNNILSAPVWDADNNKFAGILDIKDLVALVISTYDFELAKKKHKDQEKENKQHLHKQKDFLESVLTEGPKGPDEHKDPRLHSVRYLALRNRFVVLPKTANVLELCKLLSERDIHRVPIIDDSKLVEIISQSSVIHFINENTSKLQSVLSKTLTELRMASKPVVSVKSTDKAIDVFRILNNKNLYGVAVVDEHGKLVANTSASDMKLFVANPSFDLLEMPVFDYISTIRKENIKTLAPVVTVSANDTLGRTIAKLAATNLHRIFVVDEARKPVGVVSLRDVIELLAKS